jgi:hypothetical protein
MRLADRKKENRELAPSNPQEKANRHEPAQIKSNTSIVQNSNVYVPPYLK